MRYDDKSKVQGRVIAGFENEKGLWTKNCGQALEAGESKEQTFL